MYTAKNKFKNRKKGLDFKSINRSKWSVVKFDYFEPLLIQAHVCHFNKFHLRAQASPLVAGSGVVLLRGLAGLVATVAQLAR